MFTAALLTILQLLAQQLPPPAAPTKTPTENIETRYARAQLQLAEANLARVNARNKQMERTVPSSIVAEYQDDVRVAKTRLDAATAGRSAGGFKVWLDRADAERRSADTNFQNATAVNRTVPDTFDPLDVERFRLRAEVAKLQLERGQSLATSTNAAQLQWQFDLLDNQVQRLKEETRTALPYAGLYQYWWW